MTKSGIYRHYKGAFYRVLLTGLESTNDRERVPVVVYISLEYGTINVRDEKEFHGVVTTKEGIRTPRFVYTGELLG